VEGADSSIASADLHRGRGLADRFCGYVELTSTNELEHLFGGRMNGVCNSIFLGAWRGSAPFSWIT